MSAHLHSLLCDHLEKIAKLYKVRPRITLIIRVPGAPDQGTFLSDDGWFNSWQRAEAWAREKGWSVWPYGVIAGDGMHVCPACAEKQEGRP